jgi:hypothetical protein
MRLSYWLDMLAAQEIVNLHCDYTEYPLSDTDALF